MCSIRENRRVDLVLGWSGVEIMRRFQLWENIRPLFILCLQIPIFGNDKA